VASRQGSHFAAVGSRRRWQDVGIAEVAMSRQRLQRARGRANPRKPTSARLAGVAWRIQRATVGYR
jgi:hypothetical protein